MDGGDDFGDFIDDDYDIQNLFVGRKAAYVKERTDTENNEDIIEELFEKGDDSKQKKNKLKRKTIKQVKGKKRDIVIPELRMEQDAHNIVAVGFKPHGKKTKNLEVGQVLKGGQSESKLPGVYYRRVHSTVCILLAVCTTVVTGSYFYRFRF